MSDATETSYEVRQFLRSVVKGQMEVVCKTNYERLARSHYDSYVRENTNEYFELVRVEHKEECLLHNGMTCVEKKKGAA